MKSIFVLFNHLDNQRYTFSKKNEEQRKAGLEAKKRLVLRFTLRFTTFIILLLLFLRFYNSYGKRC